MPTARLVRTDELDELLTLYRMLNPDDPDFESVNGLGEQWDAMLADDHVDVVGVEHDGRLVASCVLSVTPNLTRGARPWAVIENVVTHEAYRSEGFGSQCVEHAVERADDRDCYKVMLLTGSDTAWKHRFYESCGFDRDDKTGFVRYL